MAALDGLSLGAAPPREVNALVTIPTGAPPMSVRADGESGHLVLERLYQTAMVNPGTLGLIPRTRGESGGALSVFLPLTSVIPAGLVIACRPVGVVYVTGATSDVETVVAVPLSRVTPRFERVRSYTDIPAPQLRQLSHFLAHLQDLEDDQEVRSAAWGDVNEAHRVIEEAARRAERLVAVDR